MKIINTLTAFIMAVLSITAGLAKALQVKEEVEFLTGLGFNARWILIFGLVQIGGGLLAFIPKTRTIGIAVMFLGFLLSAVLVFQSGSFLFGIVSIAPVFATGLLVLKKIRENRKLKDDA